MAKSIQIICWIRDALGVQTCHFSLGRKHWKLCLKAQRSLRTVKAKSSPWKLLAHSNVHPTHPITSLNFDTSASSSCNLYWFCLSCQDVLGFIQLQIVTVKFTLIQCMCVCVSACIIYIYIYMYCAELLRLTFQHRAANAFLFTRAWAFETRTVTVPGKGQVRSKSDCAMGWHSEESA